MTDRPYAPPAAPRDGVLGEAKVTGVDNQPVSKLLWVPRGELHANDWNPNRHDRRALALLAISILEDGWTQPVVARRDGTIIDGFHRHTVADWGPLQEMTGGMVPMVVLTSDDAVQERMATIRHNRARGSHYVRDMANLAAELSSMGEDPAELGRRLQMEDEEVHRLLDRGAMPQRGGEDEFGQAWRPGPAADRT